MGLGIYVDLKYGEFIKWGRFIIYQRKYNGRICNSFSLNFIQNIHIRFKKEENFSNHNAILSSGGRYIYFSKLYIKIMGLFLKIYLTFWYNVFWVFISCHSLRLSTKKRQIEKVQRKHKNSITSIDIDLRFENKLMLQSQSPQMNQYMSYRGRVVDYLRKMNWSLQIVLRI